MSYYVSAVSDRARNNWPKIFEQLGIFIPPNHRHGPCPCCGGKDRFRMDDLEGRAQAAPVALQTSLPTLVIIRNANSGCGFAATWGL